MIDSKINFDTKNIVIACYPPWTGGKFVLNSLGLSRHMVLQDSYLADRQLSGQLTSVEKHQLLLERLAPMLNQGWLDLGLGCQQLFGDIDYENIFLNIPESLKLNPVIAKLTQSDLKFGLVAHSYPALQRQLVVWKNACVLFLENHDQFLLAKREKNHWSYPLLIHWRNVRASSWPENPPWDLAQYQQLDAKIQQELETTFAGEIKKYLCRTELKNKIEKQQLIVKQQICQTNTCITWNCDWFLDQDQCLLEIENIYHVLGFDDFDKKLVLSYYQNWIETIQHCEK